jgi:hypothetical protein
MNAKTKTISLRSSIHKNFKIGEILYENAIFGMYQNVLLPLLFHLARIQDTCVDYV